MRYVYFHGQMAAYGFFRGDLKKRTTTLLFTHSRPQKLLDLHMLAWQEAQSQSLSALLSLQQNKLRFAVVSGPPTGQKALSEFNMSKGIVVSSFVFRFS
jgi:hypothetical protein